MDKKKRVKACLDIVYAMAVFILLSPLLIHFDIIGGQDVINTDCLAAIVMGVSMLIAIFSAEKEQKK